MGARRPAGRRTSWRRVALHAVAQGTVFWLVWLIVGHDATEGAIGGSIVTAGTFGLYAAYRCLHRGPNWREPL